MALKHLFTVKTLVLTALFAALTAIASQLSIPIAPVPFSLGIAAVFLAGAVLPPFPAVTSLIVYLLLGAAGLPVFSGFQGGVARLLGPTGGYLCAYPLMALFIALGVKYIRLPALVTTIAATVFSLVLCYGLGSAWLAIYLHKNFTDALLLGAAPYVLFDLIKAVACSLLAVAVKKRLSQFLG